MKWNRIIGMMGLLVIFTSADQACTWGKHEQQPQESRLPAPDYARADRWLVWPGTPSPVDETPAGLERGEHERKNNVDVFFIHPTTYFSFFAPNAAYNEGGATETRLQNGVLRFQASVFNACCRIFAPHYRQAALPKITGTSPASLAAAGLAYSDVQRAFDYYIAHENNRRPFILASHSQGSTHAIRLLQERIIGTPLQQKMIAAYVIGGTLPEAIAKKGLPICNTPTQTNCAITWNTVRDEKDDERRKGKALLWWDGRYMNDEGKRIVCVNPLSWTLGGTAPASANLGSVYSNGPRKPIPAPVANVTGATCRDTLLNVSIRSDQRRHFSDILTLFGVYHDFDYGLFYVNIRNNVNARIQAYLEHHS